MTTTAVTTYDHADLYYDNDERDQEQTRLRTENPVAYDKANDIWLITRYEDICEVSRDTTKFSSTVNGIAYWDNIPLSVITMDDPEHSRLRRVVSREFTPRMVKNLRDNAERYTHEAIDQIQDAGEADFVQAVSAVVPLKIIADMLGIPHEDVSDVWEWTDTMMDAAGRPNEAGVPESAASAFSQWSSYLDKHVAERLKNPGSDLVSALAHSGEERLNHEELTMFGTLLVVAGNETTRHTTTRGIEAIHYHPEERQKLIDDPSLIPLAAEEVLRWSSVVRGMMRTTTVDTTIRETEVPAGARLMLLYRSANRDGEVFEDPFEFRVNRDPNPQLAFGIGTHYCLGANLARMEVEIMMEATLSRLPDIAIAPGCKAEGRANGLIEGVRSMPVQFTPQ